MSRPSRTEAQLSECAEMFSSNDFPRRSRGSSAVLLHGRRTPVTKSLSRKDTLLNFNGVVGIAGAKAKKPADDAFANAV
ncbi:unnamed protein product [Lota lota]